MNGIANSIEVLTEKQLESALKLRPGAMRRMRKEGRSPEFCRVGKLIRYRVSSVEQWLRENTGGHGEAREGQPGSNGGQK